MPRGIPKNKPALSSIHVEKCSIACVHAIKEAVIAVKQGAAAADYYNKHKGIRRPVETTRKIKNLTD